MIVVSPIHKRGLREISDALQQPHISSKQKLAPDGCKRKRAPIHIGALFPVNY